MNNKNNKSKNFNKKSKYNGDKKSQRYRDDSIKNKYSKHKTSSNEKDNIFECISMTEEGKGLIRFKGKEMPIANLITGESAKIDIKRNKTDFYGLINTVVSPSPQRVPVKCKHYDACGGCQLQHISSQGQKEFKQNTVQKLMKPYGKVNPIISMDDPYDYRNKIHAAYGVGRNNEIISGFYGERSHNLIPVERCVIQDPKADAINKTIRSLLKSFKLRPYDERRRTGFLRHVLVKTAHKTGEVMVVLVAPTHTFPSKKNFVKSLLQKHPEITTIILNINNKQTSMVLGDRETILYGKGTIVDELCGFKFNISPKSFYQINPIQTEKLYNAAIEMANFSGRETVLDAYSGIGTIGIIMSKKVKKVICVELNKDAVSDAITNAKMNDVKNVRFHTGDAGEFMIKMASQGKKLDTVIMDPPRSGSDEKFLSSIIRINPKNIVYVSCNPVTQARDLEYLTKHGFKVEKIQPVDMFPQTYHVENIVKLVRTK